MENDDLTVLYAAMLRWVQSATVRIAALEGILRRRLDLTDEELQEALDRATADYPLFAEESPEPFEEMLAFLSRSTKGT